MRYAACFFVTLSLVLFPSAHAQEAGPLVLSQTISLPDVQGGFNHMSVDAAQLRLFAAAPTNKTVEIVDLKTGKPWKSLEGEKPAAVRYAPEFNQLYVSRGQSVVIYDGKTFAVMARVDVGSNLDELQYDASRKRLYVGCMTEGKTGIAVISIPEGKLLKTIALPDKLQGIAVDSHTGRIYANMPDLNQVAVMDSDAGTLVQTWTLTDATANVPLGLDATGHRLFVGMRHPARLFVLDTESGKTIANLATNSDADDLFYDPLHRRIYISCGEGFVDVIEQQDRNDYRMVARVPTIAGARTSTLSTELGGLYVGVPRIKDEAAKVVVLKTGK